MYCKYYQFNKDMDYPIYVKVIGESLNEQVKQVLEKSQFSELSDSESKVMLKKPIRGIRVLEIDVAGGKSLLQINSARESDNFGSESIVPATGYRVYRYRGLGLMVYSFGATLWQLGVTEKFGVEQFSAETRIILARFLSLALSKHGVIGFWGAPVDNGIVVMKSGDSRGEAVFVDIMKMKLLVNSEVKDIKNGLQIVRLKKGMTGKCLSMKREELISYLLVHNSYLDYGGLSVVIRQMVSRIISFSTGMIYPVESFRSGSNLSL